MLVTEPISSALDEESSNAIIDDDSTTALLMKYLTVDIVDGVNKGIHIEVTAVESNVGASTEAITKASSKVVMAGSAAVGKTCILTRYMRDSCNSMVYEPTIGMDYRVADVPIHNHLLSLQIWDSSGDVKMQNISRSIYKNADCLILLYDITSRDSFEALETYWDNFISYASIHDTNNFPVLLVGNKCDISDKRAVPLEEVMDWCVHKRCRKPITYVECSAKCNICIDDIFIFAAEEIYNYTMCGAAAIDDNDAGSADNEDDVGDIYSDNGCSADMSAIDMTNIGRTPYDNVGVANNRRDDCWVAMLDTVGCFFTL